MVLAVVAAFGSSSPAIWKSSSSSLVVLGCAGCVPNDLGIGHPAGPCRLWELGGTGSRLRVVEAPAETDVRVKLGTVAAAAVGALALAGCGVDQGAGGSPGGNPSARSSPYALYTHCGIDEANIEGRWYQANPPLSDGSGNPPKGWGNPFQQGVVTFTSETEVVFSDDAGHRVLLILRAGASGPRRVCD